jgi:hypothetical protein
MESFFIYITMCAMFSYIVSSISELSIFYYLKIGKIRRGKLHFIDTDFYSSFIITIESFLMIFFSLLYSYRVFVFLLLYQFILIFLPAIIVDKLTPLKIYRGRSFAFIFYKQTIANIFFSPILSIFFWIVVIVIYYVIYLFTGKSVLDLSINLR